ncbi:MAG: hypothetical protein J2P21_23060 [Chloracidobacterium sp.]|nr:hypothetical protein [Chloracidobacterium sp.]
MQGDFTRLTYDPAKRYSRVLMQQGRVQLDADWNELVAMQLHFLRALAADLIGPYGGPGDSFLVKIVKDDKNQDMVTIQTGHYYVAGILCENLAQLLYTEQQGSPPPLGNGKYYLLYLDVWERHLTFIEDENDNRVGIREVALRGPDTATRAQIVWQVKPIELSPPSDLPQPGDPKRPGILRTLGDTAQNSLHELSDARLKAHTKTQLSDDNPCIISPASQYRGAENQLYRVEIHQSGKGWDGAQQTQGAAGAFKWSRENGSVIFPITSVGADYVILENLGRDARFGLSPNDWVEIVDDDSVLQNRAAAPPLLQIKEIDTENMKVTMNTPTPFGVGADATKHPILRRWDSPGAITIQVPAANDGWIALEDGIEIRFEIDANSSFRAADYWLIPARTATGDVEWPGPPDNPLPRQPQGVRHHYAPLAVISVNANGGITSEVDMRRKWTTLAN